MRNELLLTTRNKLEREAMKAITAGSSDGMAPENKLQDTDPYRTNGRRKGSKPLALSKAYRMLSRRECEVLDLLAEDKSNRKIAEKLFITESTVEKHITNIGKTLGLPGRGQVREWVIRRKESA